MTRGRPLHIWERGGVEVPIEKEQSMDGILTRIRHRNRSAGLAALPTADLHSPADDGDSHERKHDVPVPRTRSSTADLAAVILLGLVALVLMTITAKPPLLRRTGSFFRKFYREHLRILHPDTYTHECQHNLWYNDAWGRFVGPYVDKHQAKDLIRSILRGQGRENLVKIVPTLAVYDEQNISLLTRDAMQRFPQPYLIKPTHNAGGTGRVMSDTYECFKECHFDQKRPLSLRLPNGYERAMRNIIYDLHNPYRTSLLRQYQYIPRQIIIEEHLPMDGLREFQWFTVNGHPVFARCRCYTGEHSNNSYFTEGFGELPGLYTPYLYRYGMKDHCEKFDKPGAFSQMMEAVRILGRHLPGINRVDLYVNDVDVYFGEITVTTAGCDVYFKPVVADRLLYALLYGHISPSKVTPDFVERLINKTPWFRVTLTKGAPWLTHDFIMAFSSESELCNTTDAPATCLAASKDVISSPLRCILVDDMGVTALRHDKMPLVHAFMRGLDIPLVLGIVALWVLMKHYNLGQKPSSPIRHNSVFLGAVTVYNCLRAHCKSLTSPASLFVRTVQRSFYAFVMVHPMENYALALAHFATYWIAIAAWRAKTPRRMLLWWLMYVVFVLGLNEFFHHHLEEYDEIRCARLSFIHSTKHYAVDETIREYILPPLFVYGYYVPKQILCWLGLADCGSSEATFQAFLSI